MDRCPPEIWRLIFAFACTDGGYTGCSLALVSKYIHETSKHFKLQSVALHSTGQAMSFAAALEAIPDHLRRVLHLFISNDEFDSHGPPKEPQIRYTSTWGVLTSAFVRRSQPVPGYEDDPRSLSQALDRDVNIVRAFLAILASVSGSLRTLSIAFECHWLALRSMGLADAEMPHLPNLTELSLAYRAPTDAAFNEFVFRAPLTFPALRRLDISGLKLLSYRFTPELCGRIAKIAPCLTHFHIPTKMALLNVQNTLPSSTSALSSEGNPKCLPRTIQRVLITLNGQHSYDCLGLEVSQEVCWRCRLLAKVANDQRIVVLETRSNDTWQKLIERLRVEWQDRSNGGMGCWDERSAVHNLLLQ